MSEFFQQSFRARLSQVCPSQSSRMASRTSAATPLAFRGLVLTAAAAALVGVAGCGSNLRPTVTPITSPPTGPGSQPQPAANIFVVSAPLSSSSAEGYGTIINYSGDSVMATAPIGPGPATFTVNSGGSEAWTLNVDGTLSNVPISSPTNLQAKNVFFTTLNPIPAAGATTTDPAGLDPVAGLFSGPAGLYALDVNLNEVDVLSGAGVSAFNRDVPVDPTPVTAVGSSSATRFYSISQNIPYLIPTTLDGKTVDGAVACNIDAHSVGVDGIADGIETATYTISSHIPLGVCPVYAVATPDTRRVYVLNRGSDTISVINSQNDAIDSCVCPPAGCENQNGSFYTCHPSLPLSLKAGLAQDAKGDVPQTAGPVYAEYNSITQQLVVSNFDGNTINIIDVSLDEYGNDSATFGTTYTVPVGKNPASVTVLADGSRAYVANQTDGTVSIVYLTSHTLETTLPVTGNPRTVVSVQNSNYGKVYVDSPNSPYVTIIRTDEDIIDTTVLVQGNAIDLRTNTPDGTNPNTNVVSRLPGAGQPCFLPPSAFTVSTPVTLANCKALDPSLLTSAPLTTAVKALRQ
jgi:DNA-binding beta-propeller fold protein YncE